MKQFIWKKILTTTILILMLVVSYNLFCLANSEYPTEPITIIVPYNPGGSSDTAARVIQVHLQKALGAPAVIVEDLPGGNAMMGTMEFLRRKADGYTLYLNCLSGMVFNTLMIEPEQYKMTDFAPVIGVTSDPKVFFVKKNSPYNTLEDLIKEIRKRPGEVSLASTSGTSSYWLAMWLKKELNLPVNLVGFPGGGPASTALIGGHVDSYLDTGSPRVPLKDEIKAIGVANPKRTKGWPDAIPILELDIFKEEGIDYVPGEEIATSNTIWVRREVKENYPERYYRLVSALYEVAKDPEFNKKAIDIAIAPQLVWWPPSKVDEVVAAAAETMKGDPEILKMMKQ